ARNFSVSGALTKDKRIDEKTGIELKYVEPAEGRVPSLKWRLYPFKNDQPLGSSPMSFVLTARQTLIPSIEKVSTYLVVTEMWLTFHLIIPLVQNNTRLSNFVPSVLKTKKPGKFAHISGTS